MAKLTLDDLASLANQVTAIASINANNALIEAALENTLSRDGTSPNTMGADLDMNSNDILNLPYPSTDTSPIRRQDLATLTDDEDVAVVTVSDYARDTLLNIASEAALKAELDLEIGTDVQAWDAGLDILATKAWSASVQSGGRFGLDDDGGLFIYEVLSSANPTIGSAARLQAFFNYVGGTATVVSTNYILTDVAAGVTNHVWGLLSQINNAATGSGENVAGYFQGIKQAVGSTWAGVFEADDTTEVANPTGGLYGIELDIVANGTDDNNTRRGLEIIGWRSDITGADVQHAYGLRITPATVDVDHVVFKKGISLTNGVGGSVSAFQYGIDLSEATYSIGAIKLGTDRGILWDNNGSVLSIYNSVLSSLEHLINDVSTDTVLFHTFSRKTSGTAANGIGVGVQFLTESSTGVDRIGGFTAIASSDITNTSEDFNMQWGLMIAGALAATKMVMTGTALHPQDSDGLALGNSSKMWSDLFLASGAVINFNAGNFTATHSAGALAFSGAISASNVLSSTYTPTLTNTTNIDASTAFTCQYMRVGNVVTVSGKVQIDPTAAASTLTRLGVSLPIASNFGAEADAGGICACGDTLEAGRIYADAANDRVVVEFVSATTSNHNVGIHFTYQII